jgi:hypothetical protein
MNESKMIDSLEDDTNKVLDYLQDQTSRIHKIYEPQWNARADLLKTIVTISSASIVLSFTFSTRLNTLALSQLWSRLVVASFGLLVVSLVISVIALWIGSNVYKAQSGVLGKRLELREAAMASLSAGELKERLDPMKAIYREAWRSVVRCDRITAFLVPFCAVPFCIAIAILAIVGAKQILS